MRGLILSEQRAVWGTLQEVERAVRASELGRQVGRVEEAEAAARQALVEAEAAAASQAVGAALEPRAEPAAGGVAAAGAEGEAAAVATGEPMPPMQPAAAELEGRLAGVQAERDGLAAALEQRSAEAHWLAQQAAARDVEQAEAQGRLELGAEQAASVAALCGQLTWAAGRLAAAQAAAPASHAALAERQAALEEREEALARAGRALEAQRDAQAGEADAGALRQRELGRAEGEVRPYFLRPLSPKKFVGFSANFLCWFRHF